MRIRRPAVEVRRGQIYKQLDKLREEQATKTRKHYKSDHGYEQAHNRRADLIDRLEQELSILDDPGEYNELPIAVVADELGLTINEVSGMIGGGEILTPDEGEHGRVTRDELARLAEIGTEELKRLSGQEASDIFEQAVPLLQRGKIELAEREYRRLEARDTCIGQYAYAFWIALDLAKGEYDLSWNIRFINDMNPTERAATLAYLGRILKGMELKEHGAKVIAEHLLAICEGSDPYNDPESSYFERKQHYKRMDDDQQRSMYIATVVLNAIERSRVKNIFSSWRMPKLESVVRNAVYTALYAESTYEESAASKMFVDMVRAQIPKWYTPAKLLQNLRAQKKVAPRD
jgi:hypothetical protein